MTLARRGAEAVRRGGGAKGRIATATLIVVLGLALGAPARAKAQGPCPDGLAEAAERYRQVLNDEQAEIRRSTRDAPLGVEESVQFDLPSHTCHRGPGQAYRVYRAPVCQETAEPRVVPVRYPFDLFYRKALTEGALFDKDWKAGSDGLLQVRFERDDDRWVPAGRRDVLDLKGKEGGHPGPPPKP